MGGILPAALSFCLPPGGRLPLSRGDGRRPKGIGIGGPKGRMRGQSSDFARCARDISPPAGGDLLFPWRKRRQNATGDAADGLRLRFAPPRSIGLLSPDPYYGSYPLSQTKHFRRAKSEWLSAISSGPLGPGFLENWSWCDSTTAPGVAEPTCLVRNTGYLIRPLRGHLPLKGKALEGPSPCLPL